MLLTRQRTAHFTMAAPSGNRDQHALFVREKVGVRKGHERGTSLTDLVKEIGRLYSLFTLFYGRSPRSWR